MQDFRNLVVWKRAHEFVLEIYRATQHFPRQEVFGLTSQLRRSAASIPANLAEGAGRTQSEFCRHIQIAFGSANEAECHLLLARDLQYLDLMDYESAVERLKEIKRMLSGLSKKIRLATGKN